MTWGEVITGDYVVVELAATRAWEPVHRRAIEERALNSFATRYRPGLEPQTISPVGVVWTNSGYACLVYDGDPQHA